MLVIGRRENDRIVIGDDVVITVVHTQSGQCKIGIEAPPDRKVMRHELLTAERLETIRARANTGHRKEGAA